MIGRSDAVPPVTQTLFRSERCLIASDLHLDGSTRREIGLRRLLAEADARGADLYLLGDLFHYWFGRKQLGAPIYRREIELLRRATAGGRAITVIPGNRDFLLDASFARSSGVQVAPESATLALGELRIHLSHGDLFSTRDVRYQRLRRVLRNRMVVFLAHHLPARLVHGWAERLRRHSERVVAGKPAAVLEPDLAMVRRTLDAGHGLVVCGHFHRARDLSFPASDGGGRFVILEPYEEQGFVLFADGATCRPLRLESKER